MAVKFPFSPEAPPPVMFSDASGTIHIFWLDEKYKLAYAKTLPDNLDNPASWQTKANLDDTVYDFDAGVDLQGRVHVVYLKNPAPSPGTAGVFYKRSPDGGRTWSSKTLLYESPYFRSLNTDNAHIRMDVSDNAEEERVYAVWDDRPQKRIFIATTNDGGLNWGPVKDMVSPQANLGYQTPYNADVDILRDKVLADEFRDVCSLYFIGDMSYEEIAETLDVPIGTVRSRLHRGRKLLQKQLWEFAQARGIVPEDQHV